MPQRYTPSQLKKAKDALEANKGVPFVDRILRSSSYPVRKNLDGSHSTHLMAYGESDGKYFAYPVLQLAGKHWIEESSPQTALSRGNVIYFSTKQEASDFAAGSWKPHMQTPSNPRELFLEDLQRRK